MKDPVSVILPVGSHADMLKQEIVDTKMSLLNQISQQFVLINNSLHIEQSVALDCRRRGSSVVKQIKQLCKKTSLSVLPVGLTLETKASYWDSY